MSLLTVLALGVLEATRLHGQVAQHSIAAAQARELADSALRVAVLELSAPRTAGASGAVPTARAVEVFGRQIPVTLQFEAGRIDLNAADESLLTAAFGASGLPENEARALAQRVVDWRDPDDTAGSHGAERAEYRRAGRRHGPRNAAFETVSELQHVLGIEQATAGVLDAFTVYSHLPDVRQSVAVAPAAAALRWADQRQLDGRRWINATTPADPDSSAVARLDGEVVRLEACVGAARQQTCRIAIVRFTGNTERPVLVLAWQTRYRQA